MAKIETFFSKATRDLDFISGVTGRVASGPLPPIARRFTMSDARIGRLPHEISGQVASGVRIYGLDAAVPIFDFDTPDTTVVPIADRVEPEAATPADGHAFAELVLAIGASASSAISVPVGEVLALSASASAA